MTARTALLVAALSLAPAPGCGRSIPAVGLSEKTTPAASSAPTVVAAAASTHSFPPRFEGFDMTKVNSGPITILPPEISHEKDYVLGYPMHVAVTIRLDTDLPDVVVQGSLPVADVFAIKGISVTFADAKTGVVLTRDRERSFGMMERSPGGKLSSGERRRMLIDLADLDLSGLAPGAYRVTIAYTGVEAPPFDVTMHAPTPAQKASQERLRAESSVADTWGQWAMAPVEKAGTVSASVSRSDPMRYCRVLRYLLNGPGSIATIPATVVDVLDGMYAPEAQLLRAEIAWIRKDKVTYAKEAAKVREKFPELLHALEEIEAGGSLIKLTREQNAAVLGH
jgi:hypothetical protein